MKHEIIYERGDLFDVNMIVVIKIDILGEASKEKFGSAFDKAVRTNEILLSRIVIEDDGRAFYVDNDSPGSSIRFESEDFDLIRRREEKIRFKVEEGEFIRAFARQAEGNTSILFLMHHLAGDGMSLQYFIEDFMTFLSGESKGFKSIQTAQTKENLDAVSKGIIKYYNKKWNGKVFSFEDMDKAYETYWKNRTTDLDIYVIEKDEMKKILESCHSAKVKYTAFLTAELIKDEKSKMDIGYAMDYRPDGNRSMGNQASGFSVKYKYDPSKSIMDNAKAIQKKIDKKIEAHKKGSYILSFVAGFNPTIHDAVNLEHAGIYHDKISYSLAKLMGYVGRTKDYSITNLTVADIPLKYGEYEIKEMMFAGPVVSYGKRIISVITCNDKTVITRHIRKSTKAP